MISQGLPVTCAITNNMWARSENDAAGYTKETSDNKNGSESELAQCFKICKFSQ